MEPKRSPASGIGEGYKYVALGGTFAGAIILFTIGGWALDRWLGLTPLFTLMGTVVGAVLGFLHVYWKLQAEADVERRRRDGEAK
jgi:F0F1-type ATP synthase assembly protein I